MLLLPPTVEQGPSLPVQRPEQLWLDHVPQEPIFVEQGKFLASLFLFHRVDNIMRRKKSKKIVPKNVHL